MLTINITMRRSSALYRCKCVLYALNRYTLYDAQLNWLPYTNIEWVCILGPFEGEITITFARTSTTYNNIYCELLPSTLSLSRVSCFCSLHNNRLVYPKLASLPQQIHVISFSIFALSVALLLFGFISRVYWFKRCVFKCKWIGQRI